MSFNQQLATLRKARGISQESLADMLGVSRQAVSKWETAETQPEMANLLALCEILQVTPNQLMGWEENNEAEAEEAPVPAETAPRKKSKLVVAIAAICVCAALAAGIFISSSLGASVIPASPLEGKENIEITGFLYEFNPSGQSGEIKLTIMPGIADEDLEYEVIRMGYGNEEAYPVIYKDGVCTAYVKTVRYNEVVYTLRVSDGKNIINKPLFKVLEHNSNHWSHEELWQD